MAHWSIMSNISVEQLDCYAQKPGRNVFIFICDVDSVVISGEYCYRGLPLNGSQNWGWILWAIVVEYIILPWIYNALKNNI